MRVVQGEYLGDITIDQHAPCGEVLDTSGEPITLHIWKNPETGKVFAIDNMEVRSDSLACNDPYEDGVKLRFHDTFTGLPK